MNVLVVAAHPDDETLGAGGTIARLAAEGNEVNVAILGEGSTSRTPESIFTNLAVKVFDNQLQTVAKILGARNCIHGNFPDNQMDTVPMIQIVRVLEDVMSKVQPDVIFTHWGGDLNIDHQITHRAVLTAARPLTDVREIYCFEVPSSTEWAFGQFGSFKPNVFWDITNYMEIKMEALACYKTEVREWPHPRSPEALTVIAKRWGSVAGCDAAEAFELVRKVI